jgi:hypothetical protein
MSRARTKGISPSPPLLCVGDREDAVSERKSILLPRHPSARGMRTGVCATNEIAALRRELATSPLAVEIVVTKLTRPLVRRLSAKVAVWVRFRSERADLPTSRRCSSPLQHEHRGSRPHTARQEYQQRQRCFPCASIHSSYPPALIIDGEAPWGEQILRKNLAIDLPFAVGNLETQSRRLRTWRYVCTIKLNPSMFQVVEKTPVKPKEGDLPLTSVPVLVRVSL